MSENILKEKTKFDSFISKAKEKKRLIIYSVSAILVLIIIIFYLNDRSQNKNLLVADEYNDAKIMIENKKISNGAIKLKEIIDKKNKIYSPLALYLLVENDLIKNEEELITLFDKVISIKKIDKENINLIKIKKSLILSETGTEVELLDLLNPIINSDSIWRNNAAKILGDYYSYKGENNKSKSYYELINIK